jgi:hypothetical protein
MGQVIGIILFILIVIVIFKAIFNFIINNLILSIIIVSIIVSLIFIYYRVDTAQKRKDEEDKEKRFIEIKSALIASNNYTLIENFAKKYGTSYPQEEIKLRSLLRDKGFEFATEEIKSLISDAVIKEGYKIFKEKIVAFNPIQFDDYIESFVKLNLPENEQAIDFLIRLLDEKQFQFERSSIKYTIEQVKSKFELEHFESRLLDNNYRKVAMTDIDMMTGQEFESFLNTLFQKMGYTVKQTSLTGDQGADLVLGRFGEVAVVQAKRSNNKISNNAIQEVVASMKLYNAEKGIVVANNYFTKAAEKLASANKIDLIDREKLEELIINY